jgi:hypothetical protein
MNPVQHETPVFDVSAGAVVLEDFPELAAAVAEFKAGDPEILVERVSVDRALQTCRRDEI